MPGLHFTSGIDDGFEKDLNKMNKKVNDFALNVEKQNQMVDKSFRPGAGQKAQEKSLKKQLGIIEEIEEEIKDLEKARRKANNPKELEKYNRSLRRANQDLREVKTQGVNTFKKVNKEIKKADKEIKKVNATTKKSTGLFSKMGRRLIVAFSVGAIVAFSKRLVGAYDVQAKAETRLLTALKGKENIQQRLIQQAKELQKTTLFGDEATIGAQSLLAKLLGDDEEAISRLTPLVQDLATAQKMDLRTAADLVAKSVGSSTNALSRYGIIIEGAVGSSERLESAVSALSTQVGGQAAAAGRVGSAAFTHLHHAWSDLQETLGGNLAKNLNGFVHGLQEAVEWADELAKPKLSESILKEQLQLNTLVGAITAANTSQEARNGLITKLQQQYPDFLGNLDAEKVTNEQLKTSLADANKEYEKRIKLAVLDELLAAKTKDLAESITKEQELSEKLSALRLKSAKQANDYGENTLGTLDQISKVEDDITKLQEGRAELMRKQIAAVNLLNVAELEYGNTKKKNAKIKSPIVDSKQALADLELQHQNRINSITNQYGKEEDLKKTFDEKMLLETIDYLNKKQKLEETALGKAKIQQQIIKADIALNKLRQVEEDNSLKELLEKYKTYATAREGIDKEYNAHIQQLQDAGKVKEAEIAEQARLKAIEDLSKSLLAADALYQEWYKNTLPGIVEDGVKEVKDRLEGLQKNIELNEGLLSDKQVVVLTAKIEELKAAYKELNKETEDGNLSFSDSLSIIADISRVMNDLSDSFSNGTEESQIMAKAVTDSISGFIGMAHAIKAVDTATTTLEQSSAVIALISLALKVFLALSNAMDAAEKARENNLVNQLKAQREINLEIIRQNALYKEGNELFSDDKWGTALAGLNTYNEALSLQNDALKDIRDTQLTSDENLEVWREKDELPGTGIGGYTDYYKQQVEGLLNANTDLEKALGGTLSKTRDRSGFAENFLLVDDEYEDLLSLYPQLIDSNGELNTELLKTVIATEDISEAEKQRLTNLIEVTEAAEEAYAQFGQYISSIFGSVGDEVTQAFQEMYESGDDAMTGLEESFSEMIEAFTRDAIEFAFLQPLLKELNATTSLLGEQYAKGDINADKLQSEIISTLGEFYDSLSVVQPQILQAYENADQLAAQAGFDSAFGASDAEVVEEVEDRSAAVKVSQAISEQTGTELVGRLGAIMMSNQVIANLSGTMVDIGMQNLVLMNKLVVNTDRLANIEKYSRQTAQALA